MATINIKLDMENPDDIMTHKRITKSLDMAISLFNIQYNLYKKIKNHIHYSSHDLSTEDCLDVVMEEINRILDENNINIEELIR